MHHGLGRPPRPRHRICLGPGARRQRALPLHRRGRRLHAGHDRPPRAGGGDGGPGGGSQRSRGHAPPRSAHRRLPAGRDRHDAALAPQPPPGSAGPRRHPRASQSGRPPDADAGDADARRDGRPRRGLGARVRAALPPGDDQAPRGRAQDGGRPAGEPRGRPGAADLRLRLRRRRRPARRDRPDARHARRLPNRETRAAMRFPTLILCAGLSAMPAAASAQTAATAPADPRVGLGAGWPDAKEAIRNLELVAHRPRPEGFFDAAKPGDFDFANAELAFQGNYVFQGGWHGIQIWDIADPAKPTLKLGFVCPGGQGDPSVYKNLLFISVQDPGGRVDRGARAPPDSISTARLRGVRIFDISDLAHPKQVATVQTCRGSHTHTLVTDPKDPANVYIYVSGTSPVRPVQELAGCSGGAPQEDPNTAYFRIDVIKVPVAAPEQAKIVGGPRIFADSAGAIAGLWKGGDHGPGTQTTTESKQCHDITVYGALGLAAGACSGNGLLLDIRDPANPKRIAEVSDPNFAFWHSATFNNDGTKVLFTDEWGGGTQPPHSSVK